MRRALALGLVALAFVAATSASTASARTSLPCTTLADSINELQLTIAGTTDPAMKNKYLETLALLEDSAARHDCAIK